MACEGQVHFSLATVWHLTPITFKLSKLNFFVNLYFSTFKGSGIEELKRELDVN